MANKPGAPVGNRNAAKDAGAKIGAKVGGALESIKMQAQGALGGARSLSKVTGEVQSAKNVAAKIGIGKEGSVKLAQAKGALSGALVGRKAGKMVADLSPKGEAAGEKVGAAVGAKIDKAKEKVSKAASAAKQKVKSMMN